MIIKKILNNNSIITFDQNNNEVVAMGKGIAFMKRNGDEIDDSKITKIYHLSNKDSLIELEKLIASIPIEHANIAYDIIQMAKNRYHKKLKDTIYISLTDHISSTIERFEHGISLQNMMLWDIKRFYKEEFKIGIEALDIIQKQLHITLPIDEAGFIALHFVEAQLENNQIIVKEITRLMQEIVGIVKIHFKIEFNEDSIYYYRFITHLKFFAQRLFEATLLHGKDNELLYIIRDKYPNSFKCVNKISNFVKFKYKYKLSDEEQLYLLIHIQNIVEELQLKN